ncbi:MULTISPECIES: SDR family NAD(P)-dependent oxidoreductase [unclassified Amycolatopsis]|uniref:SDR family NAD(P)-dependent oxidoreductase n=1 Tax=unclassified Amycolatopsis TaxID=2618356 RepID=UPI001C69A12A|nr:SDR family NAD(P)-dependent oxidoreductase [Amycolatopsis sp. DSM 110486]QYN21507.1 SDR family NAD(P)-dependent oxidoreductase [Amycolatopsis sp. DSM 110486]
MTRSLLAGKTAIVTGAGQGIGAGIARALAHEAASVAVVDLDGARAAATAKEVGGLAITCDVSDVDQVDSAVAAVVRRFGSVDVLVNNAMAQKPIPLHELDPADFELPFRVGPFGSFLFMRACFPYLRTNVQHDSVVLFVVMTPLSTLGTSLAFAALPAMIAEHSPSDEIAMATGMYNTTRAIGGSLGGAVFAFVLSSMTLPGTRIAGEGAYVLAWTICAAAGVITIDFLALVGRGSRRK